MMLPSLLLLLGLVAIGAAGQAPHPGVAREHSAAAGEIGSRLPDFTVKDLRGHVISSADLRGKVVLIDFWATWCAPCKKEMPGYQELLDRYGPRGLAVIGLKANMMKDTEDPMQFAKQMGIHYPLAVATDALTQKFGGIEGLPTTMLYDRAGILRKKVIGFEYTSVIEDALKPLLGEAAQHRDSAAAFSPRR